MSDPSPRAASKTSAARDDHRINCTWRATNEVPVATKPPRPLVPNMRKRWRPMSTSKGARRAASGSRYGVSIVIEASLGTSGHASLVPKTSKATTCSAGQTATRRNSDPAESPHIGHGVEPFPILRDVGTALHHTRNTDASTARG